MIGAYTKLNLGSTFIADEIGCIVDGFFLSLLPIINIIPPMNPKEVVLDEND